MCVTGLLSGAAPWSAIARGAPPERTRSGRETSWGGRDTTPVFFFLQQLEKTVDMSEGVSTLSSLDTQREISLGPKPISGHAGRARAMSVIFLVLCAEPFRLTAL